MKRQKKKPAVRLPHLVLTAVLAALIAALTLYAHIPFPMTSEGYVHLGDGVVYLAACFLPAPYAAAAAAIGCGLADLTAPAWLPATLVLKPCMALLFTSKRPKALCGRNILALFLAALVNVGGYYLYEGLILGQWAALLSVVGNLIQSGVAAGLFPLLGAAMDQTKIKSRLLK